MSIPNVSSLYQRLNRGAEGGHEFARIINQLLICDADKEGFVFNVHSDSAGDYRGVDAIMIKGLINYGLQYKWFSSSFQSHQKADIKKSLENATSRFPNMETWILVIPEDPNRYDMKWIEEQQVEKNLQIQVWGHTRIISLMMRHKQIGEKYYPELTSRSFSILPLESDFNYFEEFLKPETDVALLFLKAQPTLADCKIVFTEDYYKEVSDVYYLQYRNLIDGSGDPYLIKSKKTFTIDSNTYEEIRTKQLVLPGGVAETHPVLNKGTTFYRVSYSESKGEPGVSFWVWCFLDGRWVFFPKPHRVFRSVLAMKEDKDLNFMIRILRWFGFSKKLQKRYRNNTVLAANHIVNTLTRLK